MVRSWVIILYFCSLLLSPTITANNSNITANNSNTNNSNTNNVVSSPNKTYATLKEDETPKTIADKFGVDVWDIMFLNKPLYPALTLKSRLRKDTELFVPDYAELKEIAETDVGFTIKYYTAEENETAGAIAKKLGIPKVGKKIINK